VQVLSGEPRRVAMAKSLKKAKKLEKTLPSKKR
jgi:hypothetical protein